MPLVQVKKSLLCRWRGCRRRCQASPWGVDSARGTCWHGTIDQTGARGVQLFMQLIAQL